ncbi:hypothetical protein [Frankia sp. R43]|uniref:hypothetical protein n=1 Tax=Frankia sp. R43 TaxID=269536 RepID=UPI000B276B1E|nr:hypothetical protein [Frankia sp. R43]
MASVLSAVLFTLIGAGAYFCAQYIEAGSMARFVIERQNDDAQPGDDTPDKTAR